MIMSENTEILANTDKQEWIVNLPYFFRGNVSAHTHDEAMEIAIELISSKFSADQSVNVSKTLRNSDFIKIRLKPTKEEIEKERAARAAYYPHNRYGLNFN
jgi:hypothetical protein